MSSESEQKLSMEELKQLNRLERLEASVGAQEALLRALSRQVRQLPTQEQTKDLARDVAQMRAELKQAGKKNELSISPPSLRAALSISIWLALILLATMVVWWSCRRSGPAWPHFGTWCRC